MSSDPELRIRREAAIREHVLAENEHDPVRVAASFGTPCYDVPAMGPAGQAVGAEAVSGLIGVMFQAFPDFHAEPGSLHHADDAVFVEVRMTGTQRGEFAGIPPTGRGMDVRVGCLFEFDGDQIVRERAYFDLATILRQLGALPG